MTEASSSRAEASGSAPSRSSGRPARSSSAARVALGEEQDDRLGGQSPSHEGQHLGGGTIEPLDVIDGADQRLRLRRLGEQTQDRQSDQEPIGLRAGAQAERGRQRVAL